MTPDPEHPCARHLSWGAVIGIFITGAAAGVAAVGHFVLGGP